MPTAAYRIETSRLVLRCWNPADAPQLEEAVLADLDHLRRWMPWAHKEPMSDDARVQLLRLFRSSFDGDRDFVYGIFTRDESTVLGGAGLHPRIGEGAREIGYWVRGDQVRRGYAAEAAAALTRVALEKQGIHRIEIRCDPRNVASAGVPRKLGFTHDATMRDHGVDVDGKRCDTMIWSMVARAFSGTPASLTTVAAFDARGRLLS